MESSLVSSPSKSGVSGQPAGWSKEMIINHKKEEEEEKEKEEEEESAEESSWTEYLADFSEYCRGGGGGGGGGERLEVSEGSYCYTDIVNSSMVSDAGSGPKWKLNRKNLNNGNFDSFAAPLFGGVGGGILLNMPGKLNFKSKITKEVPYDDSLEDTASSPVNSPKIAMGLKRMDINSREDISEL